MNTDRPDVDRRALDLATTAYCAVLPLDIIPLFGGRSVAALAGLALLLCWFIFVARTKSAVPVSGPVILLLYLLLTWNVATLFWTPSVPASMQATGSLVIQLLTFVALCEGLPGRWRECVRWFARGGLALSVWVIFAPVSVDRAGRTQIAGVDENVTALVLSMGLAAAVFVAFRMRDSHWWIVPIQIGIMGAAILKVGSRTGVVALIAVLIAGILLALRRSGPTRRRQVVRAAVISTLGLLFYQYLVVNALVPERILDFVSSPTAVDSSHDMIVDQYLRTQDTWFWRGVGYGADLDYIVSVGDGRNNAHSLFWKTWVESGLVGLALMVTLFVSAAVSVVRRPQLEAVVLMSCPIAAFALTLGGDRTSPFWFVVALAFMRPVRSGVRDSVSTSPALGSH